MRIVQVILAFYPCQVWGGPPQNTLILSKGLRSRGYDVEVLTTNILDYRTRMSSHSFRGEWEGIPVTYLQSYWVGKRTNSIGFILAPDLWRHRSLIREADVIHIQGYRHFLFVGASLLAQAYGTPYIVQARGALPSHFGRSGLKRLFDNSLGRFILSRAAYTIALNNDEVDNYAARGVLHSRIKKILNPFDPTVCPQPLDAQAFRQRYGLRPDEKVVLFLARLHEKKGVDLLIRAVAALDRSDVRLCIVGPDDGYLAAAEHLIHQLDLSESTIITGPLYDREKFEAYRAADVYVLPTRGGEGLPTTILEACYAGTPIIVTQTTEVAQIVDGRIGLAVDYDVDQLKNALLDLLDNPDLQQKFRQQTDAVMQEYFDLDTHLDRFEGLYQACLNL